MSEELDVLEIVCQRLKSAGISFMITGSIAGNFYAVPRMTRDIDIVIEVNPRDSDRFCSLFEDKFYLELDSVKDAIEKQGMFNMIHNEYVLKVDFIVRKDSPYRELEFRRRRSIMVESTEMSIVSIEDLIISKLLWAKDSLSEIQLGDIKNLLSRGREVDMQYVEKWVESLDLQDVYSKVKP